jgi:hypothetical protein
MTSTPTQVWDPAFLDYQSLAEHEEIVTKPIKLTYDAFQETLIQFRTMPPYNLIKYVQARNHTYDLLYNVASLFETNISMDFYFPMHTFV